METISIDNQKEEIADWIESLSEGDARMIELYSIELKDQNAKEFITQVESAPWFKTMQRDFNLVDKVYEGILVLIGSLGVSSLFFLAR